MTSILSKLVTLELAAQCCGCTVQELRAYLAMEDFIPVDGMIDAATAFRCHSLYAPPRGDDEQSRMRRMRREQ